MKACVIGSSQAALYVNFISEVYGATNAPDCSSDAK